MEPKVKIGWQVVPNKVSERMINSSLIHMLVPMGKIRRRTKMLNNMIKKKLSVPSYCQYTKLKEHVLREISDDSGTDTEFDLADGDFKRIYINETSQYNQSISMCDLDSSSPGKDRLEQASVHKDNTLIYKSEVSKFNTSIHVHTLIPTPPSRVQPKRAVQRNFSMNDIKLEENELVVTNSEVEKVVVKKPTLKGVIAKKPKLKGVTAKKPTLKIVIAKKPKLKGVTAKKPKLKGVIAKKVKVKKISVKKAKGQKNPKNTQVEESKKIGWQIIAKRKHMPSCIAPTNNTPQTYTTGTNSLCDISLPSCSQQEIQPSTSSITCVSNKEHVCTDTNDLKNDEITRSCKNKLRSHIHKSNPLKVKRNLLALWKSFTSSSESLMQTCADKPADVKKCNDMLYSESAPACEKELSNAEEKEFPEPLSNNGDLMHHPKDSGIDDDSQEESGDRPISIPRTKNPDVPPIQEECVNGNTSVPDKEKKNEELQDPFRLNNLEDLENVHSEIDNVGTLGGIVDNSMISDPVADRVRKPSESDDTLKPKVVWTEIVNRKYKIISTESSKEGDVKIASTKALTVKFPSVNKYSESFESSENPSDHESIKSHQSRKSSFSSRSSRHSRRSSNSKSSGNSKQSGSSKCSNYSNCSNRSQQSHRSEYSHTPSPKRGSESPELCSDNERIPSSQRANSSHNSETLKRSRNSESSRYPKPSKRSDLSNNLDDNDSSGYDNADIPKNQRDSENSDQPDTLKNFETPKILKTSKRRQKSRKQKSAETCESSDSFHSPVAPNSTTCSTSIESYNSHIHSRDHECDTDSQSQKTFKRTDTPMGNINFKYKNPEHLKTPKTPKTPRNLKNSETPKKLLKNSETSKKHAFQKFRDPSSHTSPGHTSWPTVCMEPEESKIDIKQEIIEPEPISWVLPNEDEDEDDEPNFMSPSTTKRLQQLKRLNLTTGSDTSSSEDETESVCLKYSAHSDDSESEDKSEKKFKNNQESSAEDISNNNDKENGQNIRQNEGSENQEQQKKLQNSDCTNTTVCQSSRPDASSTVEKRKKKKHKNCGGASLEDETISHFSPIPSTHLGSAHRQLTSASPVSDAEHESFLSHTTSESATHESKHSNLPKKRRTNLGASTATPSEADSLRYVLNVLKRKKALEGELFQCTEESDVAVDPTPVQEIPKQEGRPRQERPQNLQDLIGREELQEVVSDSLFKLKNISDDDEIFVLNMPVTVDLNNLPGMRIVMKRKNLKIGTDNYKAVYKNAESISCVIRTGKKRRQYKTVNIKPTGSIVVQGKVPYSSLLNTGEPENDERHKQGATQSSKATPSTKKKLKRKHQISAAEEICAKKEVKRLKSLHSDGTE